MKTQKITFDERLKTQQIEQIHPLRSIITQEEITDQIEKRNEDGPSEKETIQEKILKHQTFFNSH